MRKIVKGKEKRSYDTTSITMELERPLLSDKDREDLIIKNKKERKSLNKKKLIAIGLIVALCAIVYFFKQNKSYDATATAKEAIIGSESVKIQNEDYLTFSPTNQLSTTGFIFYANHNIEKEAYAPLCREIANYGYKVILLDSPSTSSKANNDLDSIVKANEDIQSWVIDGDAKGGSTAINTAVDNKFISGVILISTYPTDEELKVLGIDTLSVWGSKDGVLNFEQFATAKELLPENAAFMEIEGGNHSQFGDYGMYKGDSEAIISREEQISITAKSIVEFLGVDRS